MFSKLVAFSAIEAGVDPIYRDAAALLEAQSVTKFDNSSVLRVAEGWLTHLGFRLASQTTLNSETGQPETNLIARIGPRGDNPVFWLTHSDTVPGGDSTLWTETRGDPFRAVLKGDRIYARGASDTKLNFLSQVLALRDAAPQLGRLARELVVLLTFGEESGLRGAKHFAQAPDPLPSIAFIGEPTQGIFLNAHKGRILARARFPYNHIESSDSHRKYFQISVSGRAYHSSDPDGGDNAIVRLVDVVSQLVGSTHILVHHLEGGTAHNIVPDSARAVISVPATFDADAFGRQMGLTITAYDEEQPTRFIPRTFFEFMRKLAEFDIEGRRLVHEAYDPPFETVSVGLVNGNDHGHLTVTFDYRFFPRRSADEAWQLLENTFRETVTVEKIASNDGTYTSPMSPVITLALDAMRRTGFDVYFKTMSGNTEASVMSALGASSLIIGPGPWGVVHQPNEYNTIPDIRRMAAFYRAVLAEIS